MNYADPNDPNGRRQKLISAMTGRPSATGAAPLFGGAGRSFAGGFDLPAAALPALSFNPFLAQQNHGVPNLASPTRVTQPDAGQPGPPQGLDMPPTGSDNYAGVDPNSTYFSNAAPVSATQGPGPAQAPALNGGVNTSSIDLSGADGGAVRRLFGGGTPSYGSGTDLYSLLSAYQQPKTPLMRMV